MINDLIGLKHKTAARYEKNSQYIDCFFLVLEARRRLGKKDNGEKYYWVFDEYEKTGRFPVKKILKIINSIASSCEQPEDGDIAIASVSFKEIGLGVFINGGVLSIATNGRSTWTPYYEGVKLFKIGE